VKERHWISLITSIRLGQTVLVLGPEVAASTPADGVERLPVSDLRDALAAELEEEGRRVSGQTLAAIAQQFEDDKDLGINTLRAFAAEFYRAPRYEPAEAHRALAQLPFSLILTISHDDLLLRALEGAGKQVLSHAYHLRGDKHDNPEFVLPGTPDSPVVYQLFGEARQPASLVLSENDLLDFLIAIASERPPLPNSLLRALKRGGQSFLFVGFGIKQWYLRLLLKVLIRALDLHQTGSSIAAEPLRGLSDDDREQTVLFYQRGTRIEVQDTDIGTFLKELTRRSEAAGPYSGRSAPRGPQPRVFISYASEDSALAARVFDKLRRSNFEPWLDREGLRGGDLWDQRLQEELDASDFALVLHTPAFQAKTDSYVNKEVALARERALRVRGAFLIPLRSSELRADDRVAELASYQDMPLGSASFDDDMAKVASTMLREYQRRNR
jgi:hypothetical protein